MSLEGVSAEVLGAWVREQRWFGSKSREVTQISVLETVPLRERAPSLVLALIEVVFQPGTHELYQLPVGIRAQSEGWESGVICAAGGETVYDAMADPELVLELMRLIAANSDLVTKDGVAEFRALSPLPERFEAARSIGAEQSNSSVVLDDRYVLKAYRRLGAGPNPELEMLRFLTEHDFANMAPLRGYYGHIGALIDATLGIVQDFVPGSRDGWETAMADLSSSQPDAFRARAGELGEICGRMHATLASDSQDPDFAPEETSTEALGLLTATVDEDIERVFLDLPEDNPLLEPILGRGEEVRERVRALTQVGSAGRTIRHHGDLHLGQVLRGAGGEWVVLDFEGEPARTLVERRQKRSPLRDVAGMLRSIAYVATASRLLHGVAAPPDWERRVREAFLDSYLAATDTTLLPPGRKAIERLLSVFELEKAVYELRYELDHRPDWVTIPVAGIARLLEPETGPR
ncbi:MAG: hypothetical protein NVS1B9_11580 [Solirubrobacteraceae bacterium]